MSAIFISYSHTDHDVADEIARVLDELRIEYFRDIKNIDWGNQVSQSVLSGIEAAVAIVVIVSPGSLKSHWVAYEIGFATALRRRILPYVTHQSLDMPGFLSDLSYVTSAGDVRKFFESHPGWFASGSTKPMLPLSHNAAQLLMEGAKDLHGQITAASVVGGTDIHTNFPAYAGQNTRRSEATIAAIEELVQNGCIQSTSDSRDLFSLTASGYEIAHQVSLS